MDCARSPILGDPGAVSRVNKMSVMKVPEALELPASDWPEIHRRAFASGSRVKACNLPGFVNINSQTFLEKLSPAERASQLWRSMRKTTSCKKTSKSLLFADQLARKTFLWPIRSGQFKRFWNWFGKSKYPGARLDLTVNFHHGHFIDPTNCPWVSEDGDLHERDRNFHENEKIKADILVS